MAAGVEEAVKDDEMMSNQREFTRANSVRRSIGGGELLGEGRGTGTTRDAIRSRDLYTKRGQLLVFYNLHCDGWQREWQVACNLPMPQQLVIDRQRLKPAERSIETATADSAE